MEARSVLCFWCFRGLGLALTDIAQFLDMTPAGVGYASQRGEGIAQKKALRLFD